MNFTPQQAVKELKNDPRIKRVTYSRLTKKMVIITHPLMPESVLNNKYVLAPVGEYRITLSVNSTTSELEAHKRLIQKQGWYHPHAYDGHGACWGNIGDDVDLARRYKDHYALAQLILNLLADWDDAWFSISHSSLVQKVLHSQIEYNAATKKNKKLDEKLNKLLIKFEQ